MPPKKVLKPLPGQCRISFKPKQDRKEDETERDRVDRQLDDTTESDATITKVVGELTGAQLVTTDRDTAKEEDLQRGGGDHEKKENEKEQRKGQDAEELKRKEAVKRTTIEGWLATIK